MPYSRIYQLDGKTYTALVAGIQAWNGTIALKGIPGLHRIGEIVPASVLEEYLIASSSERGSDDGGDAVLKEYPLSANRSESKSDHSHPSIYRALPLLIGGAAIGVGLAHLLKEGLAGQQSGVKRGLISDDPEETVHGEYFVHGVGFSVASAELSPDKASVRSAVGEKESWVARAPHAASTSQYDE